MNGILRFEHVEEDSVTCLVIGCELLLLVAHDLALLLRADDDLDGRFLDLLHGDRLFVGSRRQKGCFVEQVFEVCAGESGGRLGDRAELDVGSQRLLARVYLEDRFTAVDVGIADDDLTVESAGTQQRRVEYVGTVGRRDQDNAFVHAEAVHLDQQLVQGLLALVVAAAETCAALSADSVDLVDKDNTGSVLFRLVKEVAHSRRADADEHLDEVGTGDREERYAGFTCDGTRQQRLTGTGRSDEQYALGDPRAEFIELLGILEEFDDLRQFLLLLVSACHVVKGGLALFVVGVLDLRLAERHLLADASAAHALHQEYPCADEDRDHEDRRDQLDQEGIVACADKVVGDRLGRRCFFIDLIQEQVDIRKLSLDDRLGLCRGVAVGDISQQVQRLRRVVAFLLGIRLLTLLQGDLDRARAVVDHIAVDLVVHKILHQFRSLGRLRAACAQKHRRYDDQYDRDRQIQQQIACSLFIIQTFHSPFRLPPKPDQISAVNRTFYIM